MTQSNAKSSSATIRDVARLAGVSVATVSRYLNQTAVVSEETAARLQAAMAELKYVPQAAARRLATRKTKTLGLLLTNIHGDFFAPLLSGIEAATSEAGYDLLISASGRATPRQSFPLSLGPHNTDGLLVFAESLSEPALRQCYELGLPMVFIHQTPPADLEIPCVTVENKAASRRLVEHLITVHGRRRIALLRGPAGQEDSHWRELGYRQALEEHGLPVDPALIAPGDFDRDVAQASVRWLLQAGIELDALFTGDDEAAVGALAALKEAGKRVPEEVAVVGFDDQRLSAYLTPPLTTVRAPTDAVGREAVRQLLNLLHTGTAAPLTLLPTELVIRRSCGCQPESA